MNKINKKTCETFCIYKRHLVNQGIWWCDIGLDANHCDESCPGRQPETYEISTNEQDYSKY